MPFAETSPPLIDLITDGCLEFSCKLCQKKNCAVRKADFRKKVEWTVENVATIHKHHDSILGL